jgi:hypothetical protein
MIMLNRLKLATAALAAGVAWIALATDAHGQPRYRGGAILAYQGGERNWRHQPSQACTYIGGPKGTWACRRR